MSTDTPPSSDSADSDRTGTDSDRPDRADSGSAATAEEIADLRARVDELEAELSAVESEAGDRKKMTIVATKGTFDMAYPPLILASTAAAFGWDVVVFHTFWGLDILHEEKSKNLKMSAVGNPSMPMPNAVASLPFMDSLATKMMQRRLDEQGTATIEELIELSLDTGVDLQACQMTMELMDYDEAEFYDDVTTGVGAATALEHMADADIQLLI